MFKRIIILCICFWTFDAESQSAYEIKSIYESGEALTSCEVNFKNLFNNWNSSNVTNADSLSLINSELQYCIV
ncbi:MAG: hypothetical protein LBR10_11345 [Prevotellaceae bacterium]|jgi:hypothetical protein|nr:hypothetical protein [Prevotellaceae bacterium]